MFAWLHHLGGRSRGLALLVLVLGAGFLVGYGLASWRGPSDGSPQALEGDRDEPVPLPVVTRPDTVIRYESFHSSCRLLITRVETAGRNLGGYTRDALAVELPGWSVESFGDDEVVLSRATDEPCPQTGGMFTLGIADGQVVVFQGEGTGGEIYAETGIAAADLLPGDRQLLAGGVIIEDPDMVWQYLEGIGHGGEP